MVLLAVGSLSCVADCCEDWLVVVSLVCLFVKFVHTTPPSHVESKCKFSLLSTYIPYERSSENLLKYRNCLPDCVKTSERNKRREGGKGRGIGKE